MGNLFNTKGNQYDNEGNLMVNQVTAIEQSAFSKSVGSAASGSINSLYDGLDTTAYVMCVNEGMGANYYLKWAMDKKTKFKTIIAYVGSFSRNSTNVKVQLDGSNNNTDWTEINSYTHSGNTEVQFNLLGTNQRYKYFRLYTTHAGGNADIYVYTVKGVL